MQATVIVPFHRNLQQLGACLSAIRQSMPDVELIIAADGAVDDCGLLATRHAAMVVVVPGPSGPAVARNRAAAEASGDVLVFVDADVVPAVDAIPGMCALLERDTTVAAVFGAYDLAPGAPNFISQFKNLSHAYVHEVGHPRALTFWAGLGAVRASVFRAVGGFDERFARPSVEDIELGYRMSRAGYAIRLDPAFRGKHLKHWTLWRCIVTDIRARGVPWTQLIYRFKALSNDLNTSTELRLSVIMAYGALAALPAVLLAGYWALVVAFALIAGLVALNLDYYRWLTRVRSLSFAIRVVPVHFIHHLCNGLSFSIGTAITLASGLGLSLPGALPAEPWTPILAASARSRANC